MVSRIAKVFAAAGRSATAAAAALATAVREGGASAAAGAGGGGSRVGVSSARAGAADAERHVDEVVRVLSPGPLVQGTHPNPPSQEELLVAAADVESAKLAWRERSATSG